MELSTAIKTLCPSMSGKQIRLAEGLIKDQRFLQHGHIPKTNYKLPIPAALSKDGLEAINTVVKIIDISFFSDNSWAAVASTQLGIPYLLVVFRNGEVATHATYQAFGKAVTAVTEGCGSLGSITAGESLQYFCYMPKTVVCRFYDYRGQFICPPPSEVGDWLFNQRPLVADASFSTQVYIHEARHLMGHTAANGWLLHPSEVITHDLSNSTSVGKFWNGLDGRPTITPVATPNTAGEHYAGGMYCNGGREPLAHQSVPDILDFDEEPDTPSTPDTPGDKRRIARKKLRLSDKGNTPRKRLELSLEQVEDLDKLVLWERRQLLKAFVSEYAKQGFCTKWLIPGRPYKVLGWEEYLALLEGGEEETMGVTAEDF